MQVFLYAKHHVFLESSTRLKGILTLPKQIILLYIYCLIVTSYQALFFNTKLHHDRLLSAPFSSFRHISNVVRICWSRIWSLNQYSSKTIQLFYFLSSPLYPRMYIFVQFIYAMNIYSDQHPAMQTILSHKNSCTKLKS